MPVRKHACLSVACDVCAAPMDSDDGGTIHADTIAEAQQMARAFHWSVLSDGRFVCPLGDSEHQALLDALMPPEPVMQVDGQISLDGEAAQ